ncbi:flagellar hook-length control protein FliK [Exiguobacterium chiriqhucha]|uniref:flagellar hook-length control protein FliK n=1 Tax=Exiguobacterium chiriqhucha TaxID=1385984 RepID=UPI0038B9B60B
MNIALLAQSMQGTPQKGGDGSATPTGQFLELLSAMLGTTPTASTEVMDVPKDEASLPLDNVSNRLEQWLQQPDSLQWLKSLPADAYRKFMDAYIGILNQVAPESATGKAPDATSALFTSQSAAPPLSFTLTKKETDTLVQTVPVDQVEENVRIIQQVVAQFKGTLGQTPKSIPDVMQTETQPVQVPQSIKDTDWMPKSMTWSKPNIDSEMVMYASKGSLPENMQARIEAALQRAPFKSGADGSKVFTVRLYPEQLGELVVKLERQNGELVVKLFASNQEAKQLLQSQLGQLQQTLQPANPNVRVEVNLTQQALETKNSSFNEFDQPEPEHHEQPKGDHEDDDHPAEDE